MYDFLIIDLCLLLVPFTFILDRRLFKWEMVRSALAPSLVVTVLFSEVAVFFVKSKVWIFNSTYFLDYRYRELPFEAYLFIFALSFMGLAIYNYLNAKFPKDHLQQYSLAISNLILGIGIAILFFAYSKWFPLITVSLLLVLLVAIEYLNKLRFMYRFYRAFLICLPLFYLVFSILCYLPIITFNKAETIDITLFRIPFEYHLYFMGMLLMGVYIMEYLKNKESK